MCQIEKSGGRTRGVRMILNHHPTDASLCWPQVERGDFWVQDAFIAGFVLRLMVASSATLIDIYR